MVAEDLIKRSDAIEAIRRERDIKALLDIPAVEPRQGKWIHSPNGIDRDFVWWKCSECGHVIFSETEKDRREFHAFCGRCGARMKGTDDE